MDIHGNKPILEKYVITNKDDSEKHDPNDLHFEELFGIHVGQPVPDDLRITWDDKHANEALVGVVHCPRKDIKPFTKLIIERHQASGLIGLCKAYTFDSTDDFNDVFNMYAVTIEAGFNVPSQYSAPFVEPRKVVFRFSTTTLIITCGHSMPVRHWLAIELYHNEVQHCLDKERAARGYTDWKLDDEWDNERWLSGR